MLWWQTLLISLIPATVTGLISGYISYFSAIKKAESELGKSKIEYEKEIESIREKSKADRKNMELEFNLKLQEIDKEMSVKKESKNDEIVTQMAEKVISGDLELGKLFQLAKQAEEFTNNQ